MSNQRPPPPRGRFGLPSNFETVNRRQHTTRIHAHHDEDGSNDHLASIYEDQDDQFAAIVPFIEHGLEQGERCLYVADDNTKADIVDALREGGIDVEEAQESGALSIHTKEDTYVRTGEFDTEAMIEFWQETLAEARDEKGFAGVRAAAEMTWALDEDTDLDRLVQYEALLNALYDGDDYVVLCQYNRNRFPSDVLSDVIRSHPLVVYEGTVCQNFYYHTPDEFFGTDHPPLDVERTVEGLVSRARTQYTLDEREQQLHERLRQQEVVADLGQRALKEQDLDGLFTDVTEQIAATLGADYCKILELLPGGEQLLLREGVGWHDGLVGDATIGTDQDSQAGYTLLSEEPVIVEDLATEDRFNGPDLLVDHEVTSGISVIIGPVDDPWGVLGVHTRDRRDFSEHDAVFVQTVANTVATAIERAERDRYQRRLYTITSNPDLSFDEKLQALFDLGCDYFDMDLGAIAQIDPTTNRFEVEQTSTEPEVFEPGLQLELTDTYCTAVTDEGVPVGVADGTQEGYDDITVHREFGMKSYLGTRIKVDGDLDRTFFFLSTEPRAKPFSEGERAFQHLMGQWLQNELDRRQYERNLEASNERLEQFAYAASHDLQEPLRMVSSYLQLLERRYADELDTDGQEFIEFAVDGADRMREMIDGLLEYSRVETRGDPLEPTDLEAVFDDVLTDLQLQIEESNAEITAETLPCVEGDASQLRQVFQNLLDNAIEYSGDDTPRIHVAAKEAGSEWLLSVTDEGIGIDAENHDRVFEVFQRLHTQDEHSGTGIGLALCRRIIERHGGDIWIDSEPDEGTRVSFTLPRGQTGDG